MHAVRAKRVRIVLWNIWKPRAVRVKNPRAVPLVITRAGTPVSNVIAAQPRAVRVKNPRAVPLVITRAGTPVSNVIAAQLIAMIDLTRLINHTTARTAAEDGCQIPAT
ncbi:hypothetical protein Bbelb_416690 [Branchiostoma belcheri]|nr:hypothetical protein Bbelb_416690 [Branchiostoma belcheri]